MKDLVGVTHMRLNGIDQVESVTVTLYRFKQYKFFFEIGLIYKTKAFLDKLLSRYYLSKI